MDKETMFKFYIEFLCKTVSPGEEVSSQREEGLEVITGLMMMMIFRACIGLGYVSLSWRVVKSYLYT
jgi:hypothetical protein